VSFQNIDPRLGAIAIGAEVARIDANCSGSKVQGYFLRVVGMPTYLV